MLILASLILCVGVKGTQSTINEKQSRKISKINKKTKFVILQIGEGIEADHYYFSLKFLEKYKEEKDIRNIIGISIYTSISFLKSSGFYMNYNHFNKKYTFTIEEFFQISTTDNNGQFTKDHKKKLKKMLNEKRFFLLDNEFEEINNNNNVVPIKEIINNNQPTIKINDNNKDNKPIPQKNINKKIHDNTGGNNIKEGESDDGYLFKALENYKWRIITVVVLLGIALVYQFFFASAEEKEEKNPEAIEEPEL